MVRVAGNFKTIERSCVFGNKKQTGVLRGMSAEVKSCSALLTLLRILVFPNNVGNYLSEGSEQCTKAIQIFLVAV